MPVPLPVRKSRSAFSAHSRLAYISRAWDLREESSSLRHDSELSFYSSLVGSIVWQPAREGWVPRDEVRTVLFSHTALTAPVSVP